MLHMRVPVWLKLCISFALLAWLAHLLPLDALAARLAQAKPLPVAAAIGLLAFAYVAAGIRWAWIAEGLGISVDRARKVRLVFVGMFASLFLPSTIGGDAVRAVLLARGREDARLRAWASVVLDRANGFIALVALIGAAWLAAGHGADLVGWGLMLAACVGALTPRWLRLVPRLGALPIATLRFRRAWLAALPASACVQLGIIAAHMALGKAVGLALAWPDWVLVVGLAGLAAVLPISLNGLGVREASYVGLVGWAGGDTTAAAAMALLWLFVLAITALPGGWLLWQSSRAS